MEDQLVRLFEEKVNNIFKRNNIHPIKPVNIFVEKINAGKHNYRTICLDDRGNKYFFKIDFLKEALSELPLKNEIIFFKLLSEDEKYLVGQTGHIEGLKMQRCKTFDTERYEWIIYYYDEGKTAGNIFSYSKDFINNPSSLNLSNITEMTEGLLLSAKKNQKDWKELDLKRYDYNFFVDYLKENIKFCKNILGDSGIKRVFDCFAENRALLDDCAYLVHRDNHTMNFILNKDGKVTVIDWGSISLTNYLYDFAEIWVHGYEFPDWQKKIKEIYFKKYKNRKGLGKLFKMMVFYLTLREIKHLNVYSDLVLGINNGDKQKAEEFRKRSTGVHLKIIKNII